MVWKLDDRLLDAPWYQCNQRLSQRDHPIQQQCYFNGYYSTTTIAHHYYLTMAVVASWASLVIALLFR